MSEVGGGESKGKWGDDSGNAAAPRLFGREEEGRRHG